MKHKGLSLSIETIIILILAITVLTVLLAFFNFNWGPFENRIKLENERRDRCQTYVQANAKCDVAPDPKLITACNRLGVPDCGALGSTPTGNDAIECVRKCCGMFCPQS